MTNPVIAIGCDHAGFPYKDAIVRWLQRHGYEVMDAGTDSLSSVDYPDFVHPVALALEQGHAQAGILLCGSGNGVAMTANKHQGIRAAVCWNRTLAALARQHNDANILAIPARFVSRRMAVAMARVFLTTPFEGGRHQERVRKIPCAGPVGGHRDT
ncbi:MAG: hypothetical protein RLY31_819 [Bacteroidota bacterium]|jgi:ribose 5-phosphate isomerase B